MSSDGRSGAGLGGVPELIDGVTPPTGVRAVRGARLREDSSFRVDRRVRFSLRTSLALILAAVDDVLLMVALLFAMIGSTPLDVVELSRSSGELSAVADVVICVGLWWPLLDDGEMSLLALVFELKASTSMLGDVRMGRGRAVSWVDSLADG